MNSTIHERPGVYSSYDASSVVSASAAAKTIGAAAVATKGTANKVELITSYEEGKSVFGEDASGVYGMSTLLKFLFANGAGAVKAVAVGKDESEEKDYASAFAALSDEEDVGVMVCDSAAQSVHLLLKTAAEDASAARRERIAVIGGSEETVAQMVNRAKAVNSERVVLVGPDIASDDGGTMSAVFAAAAVAAVIAGNTDPSVPINGAELTLFGAAGKRLSDNEIDQLVRGGVTPIETVGGVSSPVRGITTKTSSGGAADTTWRELTTILIVDEVIPTIRSALRTRFARQEHRAEPRGHPLAGGAGARGDEEPRDRGQLRRGAGERAQERPDGVPGGIQLYGGARAEPHLSDGAHHGVRRKNMANTVLPLSSDIYLEVDGKKVAVVQSYTTRATRTSREIEAFGENEPVATIAGANKYTLELSRLYATDEAISDGINFYDLNDFSLVICKPDKRIIYSQCRWSSIEEAGKLGDPAAEKVTIIARKRMEIAS